MLIRVETARDDAGVEKPIRLDFDGRSLAVETTDRWPGPNYEYFKVRADDNAVYILRHDETRGVWELTMFERPTGSTQR